MACSNLSKWRYRTEHSKLVREGREGERTIGSGPWIMCGCVCEVLSVICGVLVLSLRIYLPHFSCPCPLGCDGGSGPDPYNIQYSNVKRTVSWRSGPDSVQVVLKHRFCITRVYLYSRNQKRSLWMFVETRGTYACQSRRNLPTKHLQDCKKEHQQRGVDVRRNDLSQRW